MPSHPESVLTIVAKSPWLGSWVTPRGEIDRFPVNLRWGSNTIAVPPGVHHVSIWMPWLWRFGQAEITVDNRADPAATIYYAPPLVTVGPGAIGFTPVKNPGLALFLGLAVGVPLLVLCTCFGTALL
jgi:hypothetical protein